MKNFVEAETQMETLAENLKSGFCGVGSSYNYPELMPYAGTVTTALCYLNVDAGKTVSMLESLKEVFQEKATKLTEKPHDFIEALGAFDRTKKATVLTKYVDRIDSIIKLV